jgi:hypothetical protein
VTSQFFIRKFNCSDLLRGAVDDFNILPSKGETIIRITGDSVLVQALREIGIESMKEKKVYDMVMAIRDAVVGERRHSDAV